MNESKSDRSIFIDFVKLTSFKNSFVYLGFFCKSYMLLGFSLVMCICYSPREGGGSIGVQEG